MRRACRLASMRYCETSPLRAVRDVGELPRGVDRDGVRFRAGGGGGRRQGAERAVRPDAVLRDVVAKLIRDVGELPRGVDRDGPRGSAAGDGGRRQGAERAVRPDAVLGDVVAKLIRDVGEPTRRVDRDGPRGSRRQRRCPTNAGHRSAHRMRRPKRCRLCSSHKRTG